MKKRGVQQRILRAGTTAHYEDAAYYDQAYQKRRDDVRFYAELARRARGPVLELGAGSGRVTLAMAAAGAEVVGVDAMPPMLARARERLGKSEPTVRERVTLVRGDLRRVRLGRRFALVVSPFNVFMHLYSRRDLEAAFATVRAHLAPNGRFVFDVLLPYAKNLVRDPARFYRSPDVSMPPDRRRFRYAESFQYDPVTQVQLVTMAFSERDRPENTFVMPLAHRQLFPAELEALLHYNGLEIMTRYGDFARQPLTGTSDSQVIVARARRKT